MNKLLLLLTLIVLYGCSYSRVEAPFKNVRSRETNALYISDEGDTVGRLSETVVCRNDGSIKSIKRFFHWEEIQQYSSFKGGEFKCESHKRDKSGKYELDKKSKILFNRQGLVSKIKLSRSGEKPAVTTFKYDSKNRFSEHRFEYDVLGDKCFSQTNFKYASDTLVSEVRYLERTYALGDINTVNEYEIIHIYNHSDSTTQEIFINHIESTRSEGGIYKEDYRRFRGDYCDGKFLNPMTVSDISYTLFDPIAAGEMIYNIGDYRQSFIRAIPKNTKDLEQRTDSLGSVVYSKCHITRYEGPYTREVHVSYKY